MQSFISLFGLFLCFLLIFNMNQTNRVNIYLTLFLLLINLFNVINYCTMFSSNKYLGAIFLVHFQPIIVLTGPMLFFYVRGLLNDDASLSKKDWLHFIPSFLYLVNCSRYYLYSVDYKLSFAQKVIANRMEMLHFDSLLFSGNVSYLGRSIMAIGYTTYCLILVFRHFKDDIRRQMQNKLIFKWLTLLLLFNYLMNFNIFYYVIRLLYSWSFSNGLTVVPMGALIFGVACLLFINCILFFFPNILYGLPRMDYKLSFSHQAEAAELENYKATKSSKYFEISTDKLELISDKLYQYYSERPYIRPNFNLTMTANDTGIPAHHISYFLKVYLKTDFITWKNNARIEYVIELIQLGEAENLTLEAISKKAGFISRTTFISSFKQKTGKTPSEYIEQLS